MPCNMSQGVRLDSNICISITNRTNEIKLLASADCLTQAVPSRIGIKP